MTRCLTAVLTIGIAQMGNPCWSVSSTQSVVLSGEEAIIVWNARDETQHFIRQATFKTTAKDFGFLVPVPSIPEVVEVDSQAFAILRDFVFPPPRNTGGGGFGGSAGGGLGGSVTIVDQKQVGDFLATTLTGTDGAAVENWLRQNGYKSQEGGASYLEHYVRKNWGFVAFKFTGKWGDVSTDAVRISFKTKQPYYPYKAPKSNWPADNIKPLTLYLIADSYHRGLYEGNMQPWEAKRSSHGQLAHELIEPLSGNMKLEPAHMPRRPSVTVFMNRKNTGGYDRDIIFTPVFTLTKQMAAPQHELRSHSLYTAR